MSTSWGRGARRAPVGHRAVGRRPAGAGPACAPGGCGRGFRGSASWPNLRRSAPPSGGCATRPTERWSSGRTRRATGSSSRTIWFPDGRATTSAAAPAAASSRRGAGRELRLTGARRGRRRSGGGRSPRWSSVHARPPRRGRPRRPCPLGMVGGGDAVRRPVCPPHQASPRAGTAPRERSPRPRSRRSARIRSGR